MHTIFVVSDGTGRTAAQALNAALTQFMNADVRVEIRPAVLSEEEVHAVVQEAAEAGGLIVHTLVRDDLRAFLLREGRLHNIDTIDLMGPLLARLSQHLAYSPSERPGLFRVLNESYFRRIETMEFAFRHDDGQRVRELAQAEIVLIGVSRTFKTPISIYLAFKGWFIANVPVVMDLELPPTLFELPPERVFALTMDPYRLAALRQARHERFGGATGDYADLDAVRQESIYATRLFARQPRWSIIDVTNKPIEEIASEILALVGKNRVAG